MTAATPVPRKVLEAALKPLLPKTWRLEGSGRPVDNVPATVVKLQQLAVRKLPQAPFALHEIDVRATITAPGEQTQTVEDKLDRDLLTFVTALDDARILWAEATKVIAESRLGYDITITITGKKD